MRGDVFGNDGERFGSGQGRQDMTPLPAHTACQSNDHPTVSIADGRALGISIRSNPNERPTTGAFRRRIHQNPTIQATARVRVTTKPAKCRADEQLECHKR